MARPLRPFRTKEARATTFWTFACHADPAFFGDESGMTEEHQADLAQFNGLPCDGEGAPGPWCISCRFGHDEED